MSIYRFFDWTDELYAVIDDDGCYCGAPCRGLEEAHELAIHHPGAKILRLTLEEE